LRTSPNLKTSGLELIKNCGWLSLEWQGRKLGKPKKSVAAAKIKGNSGKGPRWLGKNLFIGDTTKSQERALWRGEALAVFQKTNLHMH
jgi:hypothetical protein